MSNPRPGTVTRRGIFLLLALPLVALIGSATAGSIYFGQIRYFPEGWTEPEVTVGANGSMSYKPSVPTGFKERMFGTGVQVDNSTLHPGLNWNNTGAPHVLEPKVFYLNFKDGRRVAVQVGSQVQINGDMFVVSGMMNGDFYLQSVATKAYLKLTRQDAPPADAAPAAPAK